MQADRGPTYARTAAEKRYDFANARNYEELVGSIIETQVGPTITRFDGVDDLDVWVPGFYVEIKEKNQSYTDRWQLLPGVDEINLFIMDELTIRRGLRYYPYVFFLVRDNTIGRLYLCPIWELIGAEKVRRNRNGKGKWIMDMRQFQPLANEESLVASIRTLMVQTPWLNSGCQSYQEVPEI